MSISWHDFEYVTYASWPTTKATECEILLYVVLNSARTWYINQKKQAGYELV